MLNVLGTSIHLWWMNESSCERVEICVIEDVSSQVGEGSWATIHVGCLCKMMFIVFQAEIWNAKCVCEQEHPFVTNGRSWETIDICKELKYFISDLNPLSPLPRWILNYLSYRGQAFQYDVENIPGTFSATSGSNQLPLCGLVCSSLTFFIRSSMTGVQRSTLGTSVKCIQWVWVDISNSKRGKGVLLWWTNGCSWETVKITESM